VPSLAAEISDRETARRLRESADQIEQCAREVDQGEHVGVSNFAHVGFQLRSTAQRTGVPARAAEIESKEAQALPVPNPLGSGVSDSEHRTSGHIRPPRLAASFMRHVATSGRRAKLTVMPPSPL
jgi:hypothetical protein